MLSKLAVRLTFATACVFASALGILAQPSKAETIPVKDTDNVFIFRYGELQSMFIVTSEGVIATDPISASDNPDIAYAYIEAINEKSKDGLRYLIYSHHERARTVGSEIFKKHGAEIIAHAKVADILKAFPDKDIVLPDQTVKEGTSLPLKLGKTKVEIMAVGQNYSNDMLVVLLPDEKVLFAVDFIPLKTLPRLMPHSWIPGWESSLKTVSGLGWDKLVPGKVYEGGRLGTMQDVKDLSGYLDALRTAVEEKKDDCFEVAMMEVKLPAFQNWGNYKDQPGNVERYCYFWTAQMK